MTKQSDDVRKAKQAEFKQRVYQELNELRDLLILDLSEANAQIETIRLFVQDDRALPDDYYWLIESSINQSTAQLRRAKHQLSAVRGLIAQLGRSGYYKNVGD